MVPGSSNSYEVPQRRNSDHSTIDPATYSMLTNYEISHVSPAGSGTPSPTQFLNDPNGMGPTNYSPVAGFPPDHFSPDPDRSRSAGVNPRSISQPSFASSQTDLRLHPGVPAYHLSPSVSPTASFNVAISTPLPPSPLPHSDSMIGLGLGSQSYYDAAAEQSPLSSKIRQMAAETLLQESP